jgi:hypothetical protein
MTRPAFGHRRNFDKKIKTMAEAIQENEKSGRSGRGPVGAVMRAFDDA